MTTIDSIKGYDHASRHAKAEHHAQFFRDMAAERRNMVAQLQDESRELGGTPAHDGSAAATLHRRVEDIRRVLGGGDGAILVEIEHGENYLKEEFERVLNDERMSPQIQAVVRRCYASVCRGHDRAYDLRHALRAAA